MAKKARKTRRKFSKPNYYFKGTGERCLKLSIEFTIRKDHVIGTIYELLCFDGSECDDSYPEDKITTKNIEAKLRYLMLHKGNDWVEEIEYHMDTQRYINAEEFARELYPDWFTNEHQNSIRFITRD